MFVGNGLCEIKQTKKGDVLGFIFRFPQETMYVKLLIAVVEGEEEDGWKSCKRRITVQFKLICFMFV